MATAQVAYNPDDPLQTAFLNTLGQGETGGSSYASTEGIGGANLSGDTNVDQYGFPIWSGQGNSHAAGTYQFQPGTWDSIAQEYGLNFGSASDQNAGAWYLAQQTYANATGGASLETALQNPAQYSTIQATLEHVWPSVTGNQAAPQGLANDLAAAVPGAQAGASNAASAADASQGGPTVSSGLSSLPIIGGLINDVQRGGLILLGILIIIVALWFLLSKQGYVPSPKAVASSLL